MVVNIDMCVAMQIGVCAGNHIKMRADVCVDMCVDVCIDVCIDVCAFMHTTLST